MTDGTVYLSKEKHEELKLEFETRKKTTRMEIADKIGSAKELGDLSENFEYHAAKEEQADNERRILELDEMLRNVEIIEEQSGGDTIGIGSKFVAECNGKEKEYQIVGSNEADPASGKISNESPIGQAFLDKQVGKAAEIETAAGKFKYTIISIK